MFQRNRLRRRPGTVAVAAAIQNKYNITMVPHILCSGFTREETEYVLLDLQFLGITDLLVLPLLSPWATVTTTPSNYKSKSTTSIKVFLWTAPR